MLRIVDVNEAERTILRRRPSGEEIPDALRAGLLPGLWPRRHTARRRAPHPGRRAPARR